MCNLYSYMECVVIGDMKTFMVLVFAELKIALFVIFGIFHLIENALLFLREKNVLAIVGCRIYVTWKFHNVV